MLTLNKIRIVLTLCAAIVLVAIIYTWPQGEANIVSTNTKKFDLHGAIIIAVDIDYCGDGRCISVLASLGNNKLISVVIPPQVNKIPDRGERIQVQKIGSDEYIYFDVDHTRPLILILALFIIITLIVGRWRGLRALIGLLLSLGFIFAFTIPALATGQTAWVVGLATAFTVMALTITTCHGFGIKACVAMLGSMLSLLVAVVLCLVIVGWSDLQVYGILPETLAFKGSDFSAAIGLYVAGIIISTMGVLDDLTISQSSTALVLRKNAPNMPTRELFENTMEVGHDHIGAIINTLVLALVGSSLPVFFMLYIFGLDALHFEAFLAPVFSIIIGSIAVVLAMPITTAIACFIAHDLNTDTVADIEEDHHHH